MRTMSLGLVRYDADEGMVFDWAEPRFHEEEIEGEVVQVQEHLYAKTLFIGHTDSIENYIEVEVPAE